MNITEKTNNKWLVFMLKSMGKKVSYLDDKEKEYIKKVKDTASALLWTGCMHYIPGTMVIQCRQSLLFYSDIQRLARYNSKDFMKIFRKSLFNFKTLFLTFWD